MSANSNIKLNRVTLSEYLEVTRDPGFWSRVPSIVRSDQGEHHWDAGLGYEEALRRTREGDPDMCRDIQSWVDKLVTTSDEHLGWGTRWDTYGYVASVPRGLANDPRNMGRQVRTERSTRHLTVYANNTCSSAVSADSMLRRGKGVLGLLSWCQASGIGVDVVIVQEGPHEGGLDEYDLVEVPSRPLDLSQFGFVLAHPAFTRDVGYSVTLSRMGYNRGGWCRDSRSPKRIRQVLGLGEYDVYLPPVMSDSDVPNPETWLQERVAQLSGGLAGREEHDRFDGRDPQDS